MSEKRTFILQPAPHPSRRLALQAVQQAPDGMAVVIQEPNRNLEQNAAMWPLLAEFSRQRPWMVNGETRLMSPEEWKDVLTAAFKKETVFMAQGLDGGFVMLGQRTREFGKKEFSNWLEFLHATAAHLGVEIAPRMEQEQVA